MVVLDILLALWLGIRSFNLFKNLLKCGIFKEEDAGYFLSYYAGNSKHLITLSFVIGLFLLKIGFTISLSVFTIHVILKLVGHNLAEEWYKKVNEKHAVNDSYEKRE